MSRRLPIGFTEVEYLESTGTQYIDTAIAPSNITPIVKMKFIPTQQYSSGNYGIFGCFGANNNRFQIFYNSIGIGTYVSKAWQANTTYEVELNGKIPSATINGSVETSGYTNANGFSSYNMYLFTRNNTDIADNGVPLKLYYCKIWDNDTLVRDFIPCLDASNRPCLYDLVNGVAYYNQGTGDFTYGHRIIPVEYIESSGTQYIDSGYLPTTKTKWEYDFQYTSFGSFCANGSLANSPSTQRLVIGAEGNRKANMSFGGDNITNVTLDTNRHLFIIDCKNMYWSIDSNTGTYTTEVTDLGTNSIYFFARHRGAVAQYPCSGKLYYSKLWDNEILIRDYIPVRDENGVGYMLDIVSHTLYGNAGADNFLVGPDLYIESNNILLRKKLALMLANLKKPRKYYCEVEYLENTGSTSSTVQYIDTGVEFVGDNHKVSIGFFKDDISTAAQTAVCGVQGGTNNNELFAIYYGNLYVYGGNGDTTGRIRNGVWLGNVHNNIDIVLNNDTVSYVLNGDSAVSYTARTNYVDIDKTIYLFKNNNSTFQCFTGKIYYCKIWDNNTLVRDFIPVLDWNMTPCMYDRVTEQLFYNQGTGDFTYGREIHYVDYLESTGTQYIDTGLKPTDDYGYKIKNTYTANSTEQCAIGCMDSGNRFVGVYTGGQANAISGGWGSFVGFLPNYPWTTGTTLEVTCNYKNDRKIAIDGTELKDLTNINISGTINSTIYLFARHYESTITKMVGRIYGAEITNGNDVVGDYYPAIDENGVGFMFDRVNHTIYDNIGTGAFKYPAKELKYLKSSGTQYIDTGTKFDCANTTIEVKTNETSLTQVHSVCGNDGNVFYLFRGTGNWAVGYNATAFNIQDYVVLGDNTFKIDKNLVYVNGDLVKTYTASTTLSTSNTLIFNRKTSLVDSGPVTIYYCKIWNNNEVVRYLIPCFKDGVACMWDRKNNVFYSNSGTGTFSVGKIIEPEYE